MPNKDIVMVQELFLKPIEELTPYINNSREHSVTQIGQVAASIKEFGFVIPILIDSSGMIVAGHCRVAAAQKLKMKHVPCVIADHMTELQIKAYVIADNKLALNSTWNDEMLGIETGILQDAGFDLHLLGFNKEELEEINGIIKLPDEQPEDHEYKTVYEIIVECDSEAMQQSLYERFTGEGWKCRILSM